MNKFIHIKMKTSNIKKLFLILATLLVNLVISLIFDVCILTSDIYPQQLC